MTTEVPGDQGGSRSWWRALAEHGLRLLPASRIAWLVTLVGVRLGWVWPVVVDGMAVLVGGVVVGERGGGKDVVSA
jgi:hypothetical protein